MLFSFAQFLEFALILNKIYHFQQFLFLIVLLTEIRPNTKEWFSIQYLISRNLPFRKVMNFRHEVNRSQMETFVIDDVLYLMALGLFEKGC